MFSLGYIRFDVAGNVATDNNEAAFYALTINSQIVEYYTSMEALAWAIECIRTAQCLNHKQAA